MLAKKRTVDFFLDLLCSWGQRTPPWAWGFSLWPKASSVFVTVFKMVICRFLLWRLSDAEHAPHPFSPQEEKLFYRNTARAIWAMLFPSPIPPLPLKCFQMIWLYFSQGKEHLTVFPLLNRGIYNNFICHLASICELQCWNLFNHCLVSFQPLVTWYLRVRCLWSPVKHLWCHGMILWTLLYSRNLLLTHLLSEVKHLIQQALSLRHSWFLHTALPFR